MCNGHNHPDGCDCGFGPPYPDHLEYGRTVDWAEAVLEDPALLRRGLEELKFSQPTIQRFVREHQEEIGRGVGRTSLVQRLKERLRAHKLVEEEVWSDIATVPLYRFGAPNVDRATVWYREGEMTISGRGWVIWVIGAGTGPLQEITAECSGEYEASSGTCKQVFVQIPLRVARVAHREGGQIVGHGLRVSADVPKDGRRALRNKRCDSVDTQLCRERWQDEEGELFSQELSGDRSGDVHTFRQTWKRTTGHRFSVDLKKTGTGATITVEVRRIKELTLTFALPAGHDYRAWLSRRGVRWELPFG